MLNFALWKIRKFHEFYPSLITNLTQHDSHGPDDHPKTIDYHYLECHEMMAWMRMELIGFVDVIMLDFGLLVGQMAGDFCQP
jgi:hypothetical protein